MVVINKEEAPHIGGTNALRQRNGAFAPPAKQFLRRPQPVALTPHERSACPTSCSWSHRHSALRWRAIALETEGLTHDGAATCR